MDRNEFVDVLKGILIIFVIVLHFPITDLEQIKFLFPFWINMAVPCFMLISGYVAALSFGRRGITDIKEAYTVEMIGAKLMRFLVPFTIAFVVEWFVFRLLGVFTVDIFKYGFLAFLLDYLRGGYGPGSYYTPVMLQFVFVFPVVYFTVKKYHLKGLCGCFAVNALYELYKTAFSMGETEYRLLIFRYLFVIAVGCYIAVAEIRKDWKMIVLCCSCMVVGVTFISLFTYTDYQPKILTYWNETSFLPCLFIVPILGYLLRRMHKGNKVFGIVGRASYHIFLVQMIYYNFAEKMYDIIPIRGLQLVFNIINCVVVGILFYYADLCVQKK